MTLAEAQSNAETLGQLNLGIWNASTENEKKMLRSRMQDIWTNVHNAGFKIMKCKTYDDNGNRIPKFKIRADGSEKYINIVDNRGAGYHVGDCTTRCISFCTGVDYETIQKEQFANARLARSSWRACSVWSKSLTSRGFCEIVLPKHVSRKVFLRKLGDTINEGVIATRSSGHLAAIDMKTKKILDMFNSAGGRIKTIYVPTTMKDIWLKKLNAILH